MNKLRNMLIATIAIFALSTSAFAGSFSMGLVVSSMDVDATGTESDRLTAAGADVTDASVRNAARSKSVTTPSLYVEYNTDFRLPLSFGVEYTPGKADFAAEARTDTMLSVTGTKTAVATPITRTASASADNFATAYVEVPLFAGIYVRGGMSSMTVNHRNDSGFAGVSHLTGQNYGVGYKLTTSGGTIMKVSYESTDYDTINLISSNDSVAANQKGLKADVDTDALRFTLAKAF